MHLGDMDDLIDQQIKKAREEGAFDGLPGEGKPFTHLDTDPLGNVLKAQGFAARWVELEHEIRQKSEIAEKAIRRTYEWVTQVRAGGNADRGFALDEWRKACEAFRERIDEINRLIRNYNLQVPPTIGQKFILKADEELKRLGLKPELES